MNNQNSPLFSLDVKIGGKQMSVPVYHSDNHDSLVQRFCDQHLVRQDYKQAVKDKIIENLLHILKQGKVAEPTKQNISKFLASDLKKDTPFKQIQHSNRKSSLKKTSPCCKEQFKKTSPNRHRHGECGISHKQTQSIEYKKPTCIRKNKPSFLDENRNPAYPSGKKVDSQLIRAYETILKKTRDPHMKTMAKKFLDGCGNPKMSNQSQAQTQNQSSSHKKKPSSAEIVKGPQASQHIREKEFPRDQPSVSKVNKCDFSLTKYELVENTVEQQRGVEELRKKIKRVGSRHRIKYYVEEDPSKEKLMYRDMYSGDYSIGSTHNRASSRVRASLSYERLPYHPSADLLCEAKYDSFYDEGGSLMRESRGRAKKFKYL